MKGKRPNILWDIFICKDIQSPKGVTQKATIIDLLQSRGQQLVKPMDTNLDAFIEFDQKPQPEKQTGIRPSKASEGQIQPPAEIKNHITDFQKTRKTSW